MTDINTKQVNDFLVDVCSDVGRISHTLEAIDRVQLLNDGEKLEIDTEDVAEILIKGALSLSATIMQDIGDFIKSQEEVRS